MDEIKETIGQLEDLKDHCTAVQSIYECADYTSYIKAVNIAIKVLEKTPRRIFMEVLK